MPIGTSDGQTYESELDQLFGDMDRAQEAQKGKMQDLESVGPSMVPQPNENDQLHPQNTKDQNDPKNWGLDRILQELGKQDSAPGTSNTDRQPDETIPVNARLTAAETPAGPSPVGTPLEERTPSPYGKGYDAFIVQLEKASEALNPSFIPSAQQFIDAPWKEKLGFILATSMMLTRGTPGAKPPSLEAGEFFKGGIEKLDTAALEHYRKLDTPVARQEYAQMIKDKITAAAEGGETAPSDITQPTIRGMKEGSDWSEVITKPDGSKETVYSAAKIERLRNLRDNGLSFTEIGEKMGVSRDSVSSMVRRLKRMDAEDVSPPEPKAYNPWTPEQDKELTTWYNNPNSDLFTPPNLLRHRSEGAINARIKQLGLEKAAEEESAKPFTPKGAVNAPETGGGSGGGNFRVTEVEGNKGFDTFSPRNTRFPDNQNITPENFGKNMATDIIRDNLVGTGKLTVAEVNALVDKHGPAFEEFSKANANSRGSSASEFSRYMEKSKPLIEELAALERTKMDPYDRAVLDQQKRRENIKPVKEQALGDSPREKAIREKNSTYPTTEDAYAARAYDQFHGDDVESYAKGKVARILGSVDKSGKVIPKAGLTDDLTEFMRGIMKESESKNVDLTKKENWKYADRLADEFTKAAIVAKRVPIAGLGFDPSRVVVDVKMDDIGKSTIGGAYMAPGPEGKGSDATYANFQGGGTIIHESIHRGLEKLRERKDLRGAFANLPADEESLTRYIMYKHAGDPEGDAGARDAEQRASAITRFENSNGETYARYKEAIDKITKAAQDEIKKRRPGGHR